MNEGDWLEGTDPIRLLAFVHGRVSDRKLRLFVVAYFRTVWNAWKDSQTQTAWNAIDLAEKYADGLASDHQLLAAHASVVPGKGHFDDLGLWFIYTNACAATAVNIYEAFVDATQSYNAAHTAPDAPSIIAADRLERCQLIRDVVGNPFRPISIASNWLIAKDGAVPKLAEQIYDKRGFDNLPCLANTLEDVCCDDADLLAHCREPGPHVKGCWAVDAVLGKN
jgi:hypothetical protein